MDTERVLVTAWGNPPGNETLGMLVKVPEDILAEDSWAAVIAYEEDGYVSDEDADSIDYAELLANMQASSRESNAARIEAGYEELELVGWAATPRYDKAANMPQLEEIEAAIPTVLAMINFNPGYRYSDFDPGVDKVAAYGIAALIAGKVASKAGLFAKLGVFALALKKFWIFIVIAIGGCLTRIFRRGRSKQSPATP